MLGVQCAVCEAAAARGGDGGGTEIRVNEKDGMPAVLLIDSLLKSVLE